MAKHDIDADPLVDADPPLRVVVLASKGATRLRYLLEEAPGRGEQFEVVGGFVNLADSAAIPVLDRHQVPYTLRDIHAFYDGRDAAIENMAVREDFDARTAESVAAHDPDLVVLAGYLHVLTAPMLDRYHPRIVNGHHGDLSIRDETGTPVYTGLDAVEAAIRDGAGETRETSHVVTESVDSGPVLVRSRPFQVHRPLVDDARERDDDDLLERYVAAHRRWMIRAAGGPVLARTIDLVASRRVTVCDGTARIDGTDGFFQQGPGGGSVLRRGAID